MELISRDAARAKGLKRYFLGIPCKHTHLAERFVINGGCVECDLQRVQRERQKDPDAYNAYQRQWGAANQSLMAGYCAKWQRNNPGIKNALEAKRRAAKLQRTPAWADLRKIRKFYEACPPGYTVDHVIPLQGELVSGLHVENNLQYLTGAENAAKGNRYVV